MYKSLQSVVTKCTNMKLEIEEIDVLVHISYYVLHSNMSKYKLFTISCMFWVQTMHTQLNFISFLQYKYESMAYYMTQLTMLCLYTTSKYHYQPTKNLNTSINFNFQLRTTNTCTFTPATTRLAPLLQKHNLRWLPLCPRLCRLPKLLRPHHQRCTMGPPCLRLR